MSNEIILYHSSPNPNIKRLRKNSYATFFPHVAFIMGKYYSKSHPKYTFVSNNEKLTTKEMKKYYPYGRVWKDGDLKKPYDFSNKIYFKEQHIPDKNGVIYKVKVNIKDIKLIKNYPFEVIILSSPKTKKIKINKELLKHSISYYNSCINDYIYLQQ